MKLVIAEKPSVGAAIAAVLGANEKRSGCSLHILSLVRRIK